MRINFNLQKIKWTDLGIILVPFCIYIIFFNILIERTQFNYLLSLYIILFSCYLFTLRQKELCSHYIFLLAILFRCTSFISIPYLSDDVFRFIWDGKLLHAGINPYAFTPLEIQKNLTQNYFTELFPQLNSPNYYSIYPTINQFIFFVSTFFKQTLYNIISLRLLLIGFDIANIFLIKKLLQILHLRKNAIAIYALNPLVILEFSGNLHFEVLMIFFILISIYFFLKGKIKLSSLSVGFAVCVKIIPIILFPLFLKKNNYKNYIIFLLILFLTIICLSIPLIYKHAYLINIYKSIQLYYGKFEFNGSIYLILKWLGYSILGYNPIFYTSKILLLLLLLALLGIYKIKALSIFEKIYVCFLAYNLLSAIVHPWYILILVALSPFVSFKCGLIWSATIFLTYYTYHQIPYNENLYLIVIEYLTLTIGIIYDLIIYNNIHHRQNTIMNSADV